MSELSKVRGDMKIKLGKKDYTLRASFQALDNIEEYLHTDVFTFLMTVGMQNKVTLRQIVYCVHQSIAAYTGDEDDPSFDEVADLVVEEGPLKVLPQLVNFLMGAMVTEEQAEKIRKDQNIKGKKVKGRKSS